MIAVIGLGFVGLATALGFADKEYKVFGFDIDVERMKNLNKGMIPFHEPGIEEVLLKCKDRTFFICDTLEEAISNSKIIFYCVGTPNSVNGEVDLRFLINAIESSLPFIKAEEYKTIVIKSTIPPSTTQDKIKPLIEKLGFKAGENIGLANNPEFLREGYAWEDFTMPDRIVIGENDNCSGEAVAEIYKSFDVPIFRVSLNTAEFIKYLSNTLLSTMISFSNDMSMAADVIGNIDISRAFKILHLDKRWFGMPAKMTNYVYPGCGFGGYCLPKDTHTFYAVSKSKGYEPFILKEVIEVNQRVKKFIVEKTIKLINSDSFIGILGLSFKPESDDVRDTPTKDIIKMLIEKGYNKIVAYDPIAMDNFKKAYNLPIIYATNFEELLSKCEVVLVLTAWDEFKAKRKLLKGKKIIDGRYFFSK